MTIELQSVHEQLKREWCDRFAVQPVRGGLAVSTPFTFGDGDSYPVLIAERPPGWILTDRGLTVAHLQFAELEMTEPRIRQVESFAEAHGCSLANGVMTMHLDDPPDVDDLVAFVDLISRVSGLPLHNSAERANEQFRTRARAEVTSWLPEHAIARVKQNWVPAFPGGDDYMADLWLPNIHGKGVATFFAGSSEKANNCIINMHEYAKRELGVKTVLAHNGFMKSKQLHRAQSAAGDDHAVVSVNEGSRTTGYLKLRRVLRDAGVPLAA